MATWTGREPDEAPRGIGGANALPRSLQLTVVAISVALAVLAFMATR